ncbi:type II toxin-antitoxin system VapC family toxin [Arsenicitalea aurantiaca]|uniref:type II toxin-antitoxin system VapC family toxin n=1 Tax=Arsenicitalea aurantiaca TaxID=1783274 RepID=UPI00195A395C|nr:type II toxin-antitoxin system VapC family toxin [Arsenicitalea aurantiaca]
MIVADASIAVAWQFEDEATAEIDAVLRDVAIGGAIVPALWHLEVANSLLSACRRKRMSLAARSLALDELMRLPVTIDLETDKHAWSATLDLADRHGLTVYDAAYLELAQRRRLPLATLDRQLRAAAEAAGVPTLP